MEADRRLAVWTNTSEHMRTYSALKESLMSGYDMATPPFNTTLRIQVALHEIVEVNTLAQSITLNIWFRQYWTDARLSWNTQQWGGLDFVAFAGSGESQQIWAPDAQIFEALESSSINEVSDVSVYPDGNVFVSIPMVYRVHCPMELAEFPFDIQHCPFTLGSWSYHGDILDFEPRTVNSVKVPMDMSHFAQPKDFLLEAVDVSRKVEKYACCPEPYPILKFDFKLHRQPLKYTCGIILPMMLVTSMGFLGFMLNPASGERVGLAMTVMLTTVAVYFVADQALPPIDKNTIVSNLYLVSLLENALVLLSSVLVVSLHNVRISEGLASEAALLHLFVDIVKKDENNTGILTQMELQTALRNVGLSERHMDRMIKIVETKTGESVSFPEWYDIVALLNESDGLASSHCILYEWILRPFLKIERKLRKRIIMRRAEASELMEKVLVKVASRQETPPPSQLGMQEECNIPKEGVVPSQKKKSTVGDVENPSPQDEPLVGKAVAEKVELITEQEIADPTQIVGRRVAGLVDQCMSVIVPCAYVIVCLQALAGQRLWPLEEVDVKPTYVNYGENNLR